MFDDVVAVGVVLFQQQSEVVVADANFVGQTSIGHLEFHVVPGNARLVGQITVNVKTAQFVFNAIAQFVASLKFNNGDISLEA